MFFFEKKNQKTFVSSVPPRCTRRQDSTLPQRTSKSLFGSFSSEKEQTFLLLICLLLSATAHAQDRVAELNAQLTLDERISLVHSLFAIPGFTGKPNPPGVPISAGYVPGIPRLNIPPQRESDASLGVTNPGHMRADGATALPASIALAATFNPAIAYRSGAMIGAEARARGFNVMLAGGVNLARDPRNGRNFEYLGEDPLLAGIMAGQSVRGIQSNGIISTVKHFVLNDQETHRHTYDATIDPAALRESDLLAFEIAIQTGHPGAVMCSYNLVWFHHACNNATLLNDILKGDWHFPGYVMADWGATTGIDNAVNGLDQESGEQLDSQVWFAAPLKQAIQSGKIPESRLADMTRRILTAMNAAGLLDRPDKPVPDDESGHVAIAQAEAEEGIVLLRNERATLPLHENTRKILIVGGHADFGVLSGGGSSQVYPPHFNPAHSIPLGGEGVLAAFQTMVFQSTPLTAAIRACAPDAKVTFTDGRYPADAALLAKSADAVIVFANQWMVEDEDAPDLSLPDGQDSLIAAVANANPHTIVVLQTGGPVAMPWFANTAAILEAWYSGAGGSDAIANILFGKVNPSGKLPITFPESLRQLPRPQIPGRGQTEGPLVPEPHTEGADIGYRWFARTQQTPLFPFGFGLSYTSFHYANLRVQRGDTITVTFDVTNTGAREGKETTQLYLTQSPAGKRMRLLGFSKIDLPPGETRGVAITADPRLLADFDTKTDAWQRQAGQYDVAAGPSSANLPLQQAIQLGSASLPP